MDYRLIRSKRKTAAIYIRNGGIEVRAPLKMPKRDIDTFVASNMQWIMDRLAKLQEQSNRRASFVLTYQSKVLYCGREYPIVAKVGKSVGFDHTGFYMPPDLSSDEMKAACVRIYRILAKRDLTTLTLDYAQRMGVMPSHVKINGAKTRWGSCSVQKSINYSWRLIMADTMAIEYVVVHELAHLIEMNHSARFWNVVEGILPDYKERKLRLYALQKRLANEDWDI